MSNAWKFCALKSTSASVTARFRGRDSWSVMQSDVNISEWRMDYFIVGVTNTSSAIQAPVRGVYPLCGQYPYTATAGGRMTVNCTANVPPAQYVIIQQPENGGGGMNFCELEVYSSCWLYSQWFYSGTWIKSESDKRVEKWSFSWSHHCNFVWSSDSEIFFVSYRITLQNFILKMTPLVGMILTLVDTWSTEGVKLTKLLLI